ncbi:helix-turn-helix transcriptional regulator [Paenibacillus thalictri]|uniref:YafY family transcriptional regulator n=1 Tax=Paenibacillus thalictri TaxID=2527873 RepID=A0A4Q9DQQ8_9BACL|nr:YafY family protein [Paenibacillus thalictri]TBL75743.1 YafY family transcriptional regulator [Paenibacillus thalictri]
MNKTDRMLAIVLELQRKKQMRAEDLAAVFETSVRTIYRDIQALSEGGVPVVGAPGIGYSLMEGYFLPPVSLTVEEAVTLLIGADFVEQRFDASYGRKVQSARGKIEAVLPDGVRSEVSRVHSSIRLLALGDTFTDSNEKKCLEVLRTAVLEERKVKFDYSKKIPGDDGRRDSVRTAAPYGLVFTHGAWLLIAKCDLRQDLRHFRLSRMSGLTMLDETFQRPADFVLHRYQPLDDRNTIIRVLADAGIADKLKESNNFFMEDAEDRPEGCLFTFRVRRPEELLPSILSWGAGVVVLEPVSFRNRVREEVEKMLKRY